MADEEIGAENGAEAGEEDILEPGSDEGGEEGNQGSEASDEDRIAESLASELGWSPKDKWRGSEEDWKPARDFLKTTVEVNKARGREIKHLNERVERIARTSAQMAELAAQQERTKLEAKFSQAVEEGDTQTAFQVSREIDRISAPSAEPDAAVDDFKARNSTWFGIDPIATQMAIGIAELHKTKPASVQVEEAEKVIRKRFPEYFEAEQRQPAKQPSVNTPGTRSAQPTRRGAKGFNELPQEAKAAALDFEKRGRAKKEEYARIYWQENA